MTDSPSSTSKLTTGEATPDLSALTARVIERRRYETELGDMIAEARMAWESENADLIARFSQVSQERAAAETELRSAAVAAFEATGSKKPAPGLGIRVTTVLDYDEPAALHWAHRHGLALKLDIPAFEKLAKATESESLWFVQIRTVPTATIAANLDSAVTAAETGGAL